MCIAQEGGIVYSWGQGQVMNGESRICDRAIRPYPAVCERGPA
jgi:hypothetical protein